MAKLCPLSCCSARLVIAYMSALPPLSKAGEHVRIAPEHALRAQPDAVPAGVALEQRDRLPDFDI